ncbi:MAG: DUF2459 domain-containing protein [Bacteriovorax sp.]|jgi:uncharacterized protein (TIGR02117 family)
MKKKIVIILYLLISPIVIYIGSALILSSIYVGSKTNDDSNPYVVYVVSSAIHTEFIFPIKNDLFDWHSLFLNNDMNISYVSIGWGSREFFFEMRTWEEIKMKVILKAIFYPSDSVVHVDFLKTLPLNEPLFPLKVDSADYLKLIQFVTQSFAFNGNHKAIQVGEFSYYGTDRFFESTQKYHLFNTCNMWTNDGLKYIDWKRPLWSPFKYGIENALRE